MMPWRLAYWPVRIEARLGEQSGVVWKAACEHRAFVADAVDVRRLHVGMAADPQLVEPQIVDQDDEEIRLTLPLATMIPPKHPACRNTR